MPGYAEYIVMPLLGVVSGIINTIAGGGSLLTIPILLLAGLPAAIANTTNRIPILLHSASATWQYWRRGTIRLLPFIQAVIPTILGALAGSLSFRTIRDSRFNVVLAILVIVLVISLYIKPGHSKKKVLSNKPYPWLMYAPVFVAIGFYGGFLQIGVGLILMPALYFFLKLNLVEANALKVALIFCFTLPSLFLLGSINAPAWRYGLLMGAGSIIGSYLGIKLTLSKRGELIIRTALTLVACATAIYLLSENRHLIDNLNILNRRGT